MAQKVPRPPLSTTPYAWSTCNTSMNTSGAAAGPGAWYKVTLVLHRVRHTLKNLSHHLGHPVPY